MRALEIPEAIHHPWELSLVGFWSDTHGAHLTLSASVDSPAHGHGGPATSAPGAAGEKAALRALLREKRRAHVARLPDRAAALDALAGHVLAHLGAARIIAGYVAVGDEADPLPILLAAHARGRALALPRITKRTEPMHFHRWAPGDPLHPGPFGLLQPSADAPPAAPDLILAPLLGFDRGLARIGQGAGFYDRAFARFPEARRIGIAWSAQEVAALPLDPWDMPLHAIATEREWIER